MSSPSVTSTVTVTAPPGGVTRSEAPAVRKYGPDGVFAVGTEPRGGLTRAIPPGRYRTEPVPALEEEGLGGLGMWHRCSDLLCTSEGTIAVGGFGESLMEIEPTDAAVQLSSLFLVPVD